MIGTEKIEVWRSAATAADKGSDEFEAEPVALGAYARAGGFQLITIGLGTSIGGNIVINYRIS